jgi:DNA-binding NtrC family response regulator
MTARSRITAELSEPAPVLLVSPDPADSRYMREILATLDSPLVSVSDLSSATESLRDGRFGIVITERDLPDGNWLNVLSSVQRLQLPPSLIVVSRLADEHLWTEVLNRSGFDVLPKPFVRDEVCRVIGHALRIWSNTVPTRPGCGEAEGRRRASAGFRAA